MIFNKKKKTIELLKSELPKCIRNSKSKYHIYDEGDINAIGEYLVCEALRNAGYEPSCSEAEKKYWHGLRRAKKGYGLFVIFVKDGFVVREDNEKGLFKKCWETKARFYRYDESCALFNLFEGINEAVLSDLINKLNDIAE